MYPNTKFFTLSLIACAVATAAYGDVSISSVQEEFFTGNQFDVTNSTRYNGGTHSIQVEYGSNEAHADAGGDVSSLSPSVFADAAIPISGSPHEPIFVQSFAIDTYYFSISGPTKLVDVHVNAAGSNSVQSSNALEVHTQAFNSFFFILAKEPSSGGMLDGIDEFHSAYVPSGPGGTGDGLTSVDDFSINQDFAAETGVVYTAILLTGAAAETVDTTGNTSITVSSALDASFSISESFPQADQFTINLNPTFNPVPEPATYGIFGALAVAGLAIGRRVKNQRSKEVSNMRQPIRR